MSKSALRAIMILLASALGAAPGLGQETLLTLKSGRTLQGRFLAEAKGTLWFEDFELGLVPVERLRVRHLSAPGFDDSLFRPTPSEGEGPAPKTYVRHRSATRESPGALETGVSRWIHPATRTTLYLVGAVHIGEPAYFQSLQARLDACDLVLFEGVRATGEGGASETEAELGRMDGLRRLQHEFGALLGLAFQMQELNYERAFWQNVDVSLEALRAEMQSRKVRLPTDDRLYLALTNMAMGVLKFASTGEAGQLRLRGQVGQMLSMADVLLTRIKGLHGVLIDWRNEAAWKHVLLELEGRAPGRWIALFYGAAHLPDFARRAVLRGFVYEGQAWISAWKTG